MTLPNLITPDDVSPSPALSPTHSAAEQIAKLEKLQQQIASDVEALQTQ